MKEYFDKLTTTTKETVIEHFSNHEEQRREHNQGEGDSNARTIIETLENDERLTFWQGEICEATLSHLLLPYHIHDNKGENDNIELVGQRGVLIENFPDIFKYRMNDIRKRDCVNKIRSVKEVFFSDTPDAFDADFILLSNNGNKVHKGNYVGTFFNKLFIANGFHRLGAYALTLSEIDQFIPIKVYYAHDSELVNTELNMTRN